MREEDLLARTEIPDRVRNDHTRHGGKITLAEGDAVARAVRHVEHAPEGVHVAHDARQAAHRGHGRVVRVQRELDARRFGHRQHAAQEVGEVVPHLRIGGRAGIGVGQAGQCGRVELRHQGAAAPGHRGRGAQPVEDGHEVVAVHRYAGAPHVADALAHDGEVVVAPRQAQRDAVRQLVALDHGQAQAGRLDALAQLEQVLVGQRRPLRALGRHRDAGHRRDDIAHAHLPGEAQIGLVQRSGNHRKFHHSFSGQGVWQFTRASMSCTATDVGRPDCGRPRPHAKRRVDTPLHRQTGWRRGITVAQIGAAAWKTRRLLMVLPTGVKVSLLGS